MRLVISSFALVLALCFLEPAHPSAKQTQRTNSKPVQLLATNQAFELLKTLNDESKLVPSLFDQAEQYTNLRPDNCFGLVWANGSRLVGESSGKRYGQLISNSEKQKSYNAIGFLYAEANFMIDSQQFDKGPYGLFVASDELAVSAGLGKNKYLTLSIPIDGSLLLPEANASSKRPRFSFVQEEKDVFIQLEGNKLMIGLQ